MTQHANEMFVSEELNEMRVLQPTKKFIVERFRPWVEDHEWDVLLLPRHLWLDHWPTMPCAFLGCIKTDIRVRIFIKAIKHCRKHLRLIPRLMPY